LVVPTNPLWRRLTAHGGFAGAALRADMRDPFASLCPFFIVVLLTQSDFFLLVKPQSKYLLTTTQRPLSRLPEGKMRWRQPAFGKSRGFLYRSDPQTSADL